MIERLFPDPLAQPHLCGGPLASYVDGFAAQLAIQGYVDSTAKEKLRLVAHLSRWLQRHDLPLAALDEERVRQFLVDPGWTPLRPRRGEDRMAMPVGSSSSQQPTLNQWVRILARLCFLYFFSRKRRRSGRGMLL